jgi:hypothetical protein
MPTSSRHVAEYIDRAADEVYDYVLDPRHLHEWAPGLVSGPVEVVDGRWEADSPMGRIVIGFASRNPYGVLDHDVTPPSGKTLSVPLRVLPAGEGCEIVFTVRRLAEMSDLEFEADVAAVAADLASLKEALEAPAFD